MVILSPYKVGFSKGKGMVIFLWEEDYPFLGFAPRENQLSLSFSVFVFEGTLFWDVFNREPTGQPPSFGVPGFDTHP